MPSDRARSRPGALFDVDGTLLDTNYLHVLAWWQAFRDAGHDGIDMATVHRAIGIASAELVQQVINEDDKAAVDAHTRRFGALRDQVVAFPSVADLLTRCTEHGLTVVLATSGRESDLDWMLPAIGAEAAVTGATTSGDVEAAKPAPDLLVTAIDQHGLDPRRTVAVGDTVWDVRSARDADLPCIALTCGGISRGDLLDSGAAEVYDDPADLLRHFDTSALAKAANARP